MGLSSAAFPITVRHVIVTNSPECLGVELAGIVGTHASGSTPAANDAIYIPFNVSQPVTALQMLHYNGAAVAGNIDVGIYNRGGTRLISSGPVAQTGTSVLQLFNITDTLLVPGRYYMAVGYSDAAAEAVAYTPAISFTRAFGILFENLGTLPAIATFTAMTYSFIPVIGVAFESIL